MGVSIMLCYKDSDTGINQMADDGFSSCPHWSYTNWGIFADGVLSALRDAYVEATKARNEARQAWEEETDKSDTFWLRTFENRSESVKRLAELKSFWLTGISDATDEQVAYAKRKTTDSAVWEFDSKTKVIECLLEALLTEGQHPGFVCVERIAFVLRYLMLNRGTCVVVA